jgi:hypothetical protein
MAPASRKIQNLMLRLARETIPNLLPSPAKLSDSLSRSPAFLQAAQPMSAIDGTCRTTACEPLEASGQPAGEHCTELYFHGPEIFAGANLCAIMSNISLVST